MKKLLIVFGGTALLIAGILAGAFFAGPLLASAHPLQATTTTASTPKNPYCARFQQALAQHLGVSVTTLQQSRQAAFGDVLAQLVKDGKLTQSQADKIKQNIASHSTACSGFNAGRLATIAKNNTLQKYRSEIVNQIAQGLHLTSDQLIAQFKAGKSLNDIAQAQNVSNSDLHTLITNAINSVLSKAVSAGDLTQTQANNLLQNIQKHPAFLNRLLNLHLRKMQK